MEKNFLGKHITFAALTAIAVGVQAVQAPAYATPSTMLANNNQIAPALQYWSSFQLAQSVGICRATNGPISVYKLPSLTDGTVGNLGRGTIVRLADDGANGFIGIDQPITGYVQEEVLTPAVPCSETPAATPEMPTTTPETPAATPETPAATPETPTTTPETPTSPDPATTPDPTTTPGTPPAASDSSPAASFCRRVARPPEGLLIRSSASSASTQTGGVRQGRTVTLTTNPATRQSDSGDRIWIQISEPRAGWVSNGFPSSLSNLVYCE